MPWSLSLLKQNYLIKIKKLYYVIEDADGVAGYTGGLPVYDEGQITNVASRHLLGDKVMVLHFSTSALIEECFSKESMHEIFWRYVCLICLLERTKNGVTVCST